MERLLYSTLRLKKNSETNWERLEAMQDKDIDLSDIPEISEDQFKKAKLRFGGKPIQKSHSGRIGSKTVINAKYQKPNSK